MEILKLLVLCPFSDILSHFIAKVISFFMQIYLDICTCQNFGTVTLLSFFIFWYLIDRDRKTFGPLPFLWYFAALRHLHLDLHIIYSNFQIIIIKEKSPPNNFESEPCPLYERMTYAVKLTFRSWMHTPAQISWR